MTWTKGPAIAYLGDRAVAWLARWKEPSVSTQGSETWVPRCPKGCGGGTIILAPSNGFMKWIVGKVEVYCTNCQWRGKLEDDIKKIYIRL
jgi:hypothetical protein